MKNFLIIVLIIGIVGGTGYAVYYQVDQFNKEHNSEIAKENTTTNSESEEKKEELDVNSEEVTSLMKKVNIVNDVFAAGPKFQGYFYLKDKYTKNEIDNKIKLLIGLNSMNLKNRFERANDYEMGKAKLTASEVKEAIQSVFGKDISYQDVSYEQGDDVMFCATGLPTFNSQDNSYVIKEDGCGGVLFPIYQTKLIRATKYKDRIEIEEKALYVTSSPEDENNVTSNIYKPRKTELIAEKVTDDSQDNQFFDKTDTYKYTFQLKDGNYYFESVELVK